MALALNSARALCSLDDEEQDHIGLRDVGHEDHYGEEHDEKQDCTWVRDEDDQDHYEEQDHIGQQDCFPDNSDYNDYHYEEPDLPKPTRPRIRGMG